MIMSESDLIKEIASSAPAVTPELTVEDCCSVEFDVSTLDQDDDDPVQEELRKAVTLLQMVDNLMFLLPMQELKRTLMAPQWWELLRVEKKVRAYIDGWQIETKEEE